MAAQSDEHGPPLGVFKPAHTLLFFFGVGDLGVERAAKIIAALDVIDVELTFIEAAVSNQKTTNRLMIGCGRSSRADAPSAFAAYRHVCGHITSSSAALRQP